jgi:peptidoglycan/LPS O-acetylase OafA/YrhL
MRAVELPALTGIRFYAALAVFMSQVAITAEMERLTSGYQIFDLGVVGVSFFLVLSGFILTYNYAGIFTIGVPASGYKQFIWGRVSKIYPVHLAAMLMAVPNELPMQRWLRQLQIRATSKSKPVEILESSLSLDNAYASTSVGQPMGLVVTPNSSTQSGQSIATTTVT